MTSRGSSGSIKLVGRPKVMALGKGGSIVP